LLRARRTRPRDGRDAENGNDIALFHIELELPPLLAAPARPMIIGTRSPPAIGSAAGQPSANGPAGPFGGPETF
jgi:hypothetical protein